MVSMRLDCRNSISYLLGAEQHSPGNNTHRRVSEGFLQISKRLFCRRAERALPYLEGLRPEVAHAHACVDTTVSLVATS